MSKSLKKQLDKSCTRTLRMAQGEHCIKPDDEVVSKQVLSQGRDKQEKEEDSHSYRDASEMEMTHSSHAE